MESQTIFAQMLDRDISYLKGVGPQRGAALQEELGIRTWGDLLMHFPFRYIDRSLIIPVKEIPHEESWVQLRGTITDFKETGEGRSKRLTGTFRDDSGTIELVWFKGIKWIKENTRLLTPCIVYGKTNQFKGRLSIPHPEIELIEQARLTAGVELKPVYSSTEKLNRKGLNSNGIARLTMHLAGECKPFIQETLSQPLIQRFRLMPRDEAITQLHVPAGQSQLDQARRRLKFEELFFLQLRLGQQKLARTQQERGVVFEKVGQLFNEFYSTHLPFELTGAQKRVIKEIRGDVARGNHMNRLIQGDVGSGKTVVAVIVALLALDNNFQVAMMVPTEILAQQHFQSVTGLLRALPVKIRILTGSTPKAARRAILQELASDQPVFIIGTHALIEPTVEFNNLGLVIIDEQHRFGVAQRASLWKKAILPPHILVMTATPIPRTLAMTLYGDLDISVIDELPPGRKAIQTNWRSESRRLEVFQFLEDQIAMGRQIYVVHPLIEESEAMDYSHLQDGYEALSRRFPLPSYRISVVHGRMKAEDRELEMKHFAEGRTHLMVATTVIEVGVNVPNASVMLIESAERFGLSQLHQLRGRVGRGADQSYCILMTGYKVSSEARTRLETMCRTTDGFEIAEVDLQLRGPGDLAGVQQSGALNLRIADLARDQQILAAARDAALELLDSDPQLSDPINRPIARHVAELIRQKSDWSKIS
jgi:ATP-dependent DNA helicase RecG